MREEGAGGGRLDTAAVKVLCAQGGRGRTGMVNESGFPASRMVAEAPLEEGRFLVDPTADARKLEGVHGGVEGTAEGRRDLVIGGIQEYPVDRGGAAPLSVAHLRGLCDDDLVEFSQTIHRHVIRSRRSVDPLVVAFADGVVVDAEVHDV